MTKSYLNPNNTNELTLSSLDIPQIHKFAVGFDNMFDSLMRTTSQSNGNYPPYNVVQHSDDEFSIELAVAGFGEDELEIELENSVLTIMGEKLEKVSEEVSYLHQGISSRSFKRSFTLAEHIEVADANIKNGILSIHLERQVPEEKKPKKIAINFNK